MLKKTLLFSTILMCKTAFADSAIDKVSYALGYEIATQAPENINLEQFIQGIREQKAKKENRYTTEELTKAFQSVQESVSASQKEVSAKNTAAEQRFLKENAKKSGVVTTASGLQYKIEKAGSGRKPNETSVVTVHYKGRLLDGTVFDSSYDRNEPIEIPLDQVIPGWTEGLQLLKTGSKATLYIPAKLGYGEDGIPETIPPNSTLIFDIELLKVN